MIEFITSIDFSNKFTLLAYFVLLAICSITYLTRSIGLYKQDLIDCQKSHYRPSLTIGKLVGYIFLSVTPCINIFALVFDCLGSVLKMIGRTLDIPFVRHQPKPKEDTTKTSLVHIDNRNNDES